VQTEQRAEVASLKQRLSTAATEEKARVTPVCEIVEVRAVQCSAVQCSQCLSLCGGRCSVDACCSVVCVCKEALKCLHHCGVAVLKCIPCPRHRHVYGSVSQTLASECGVAMDPRAAGSLDAMLSSISSTLRRVTDAVREQRRSAQRSQLEAQAEQVPRHGAPSCRRVVALSCRHAVNCVVL
jgi:hypothetical protein